MFRSPAGLEASQIVPRTTTLSRAIVSRAGLSAHLFSSIAQGLSGVPHFDMGMGRAHNYAMQLSDCVTVAPTTGPLPMPQSLRPTSARVA